MASKKSFVSNIENTAELFISKPETPAPAQRKEKPSEEIPTGYKTNPLYVETRSKRLQLLVQPSIADKLKAKAKREDRSVNDIVHSILEDALREE